MGYERVMTSSPYLVLGYALKSDSGKCAIYTRITYKANKSPTYLSYAICNTMCVGPEALHSSFDDD